MDRLASSLSFTTAQEIDGVIVALIMQAKPLPRFMFSPLER
jgi:hypothetical protein